MVKHYLQYLNTDDNIIPILFVVFVASFVISFLTFKPLLLVIIKKKLHDQPNNRSAHQTVTPTIGGVSIYISLVLIICLFGAILRLDGLLILVGCLTLLFFLGLNDDLDDLKPFRKAFIQFLVSLFIVAITDVRVLRGIGGGCDEEAIRVVKSMPKWSAGKQRGKPVKVKYTLPITFKVE